MISGIRNSISNKAFKYILWGAVIAIPGGTLLVGLLDRSGAKGSDTVASVNGYGISRSEFRDKVRELEELMKHDWYRLLVPNALDNPIDQALTALVQEKVLVSAADNLGLQQPSEDYIAAKLDDSKSRILPDYLYDSLGNLDKERLNLFLRKQGISLADFENRLENIYKQQFATSVLQSASYVPNASIDRSQLANNNKQDFITAFLDINDYIKKSKDMNSSQDMKAEKDYFKQQNAIFKRYWTPEKRSATVWEFSPKSYGITVSEKEVKNSYERNKKQFGDKNFKDVSKELAEKLKKEKFANRFAMDARRTIAEVANNSQALQSFAKKHGGAMTKIPLQELQANNAQSKKLFSLSKPGKAGFVMVGPNGYIVLFDEVIASHEPKFDMVAEQVATDYHTEKAFDVLKSDLKDIKEELGLGVPASEVAKKWNTKVEDRSFESRNKQAWEKADKDGLPVSRMRNMIHPGYAIEHIDPRGGYIVQLQSIEPLEGEEEALKTEILRKQENYLFVPAFIASLQNNATIEYNDNIASQA